ncbi:MAG: helix-turn-helix domain-containing protein, partial [Lactococcus lactis]|nr:helix-turn-helix domain-containing protein [Lactococcus lactis]MDN5577153.1 helix-turn-helix domain-containing protein [Lactococcus lactis]MDN6094386.1 helix-turn-helix domain-containing protein [Lactococcus lactis]MDN6184376.1 helix-turn-helix domain-containing protein [Lactococcus lactis]
MPYKRYGEIFKKLREQKNFSLSHFSEIGISKASLSRFELGQTMISFERLDSALQEMNVTLAEYEHFINNFSMDYKEEFLEDIILADIADDVDKLHSLYLEAMEYDSKMLAYCAKS